jgi:ligand-binding sensor domain-containing protein
VHAGGDEILALVVDPVDPDRLWAGTEGGGVVIWDLRTGQFRQHLAPTQPGLASNVIYDIAFDAEGASWLATADGVTRVHGETWTHDGRTAGLPAPVVRSIAVDHTGAVWAALWDQGLVRRAPGSRRWSVVEPDDFAPGTSRPPTGPGAPRVVDMAVDGRGRLWLAHGRGATGAQPALSVYDPGPDAWRHVASVGPGGDISQGPSTDQITALAVDDSTGRLWLATWARGVLAYDGARWFQFSPSDGLCGRKVWAIAAAGGAAWAACGEDAGGGGVSRWDGQGWQSWGSSDGLPTEVVTAIALTGQRAYLGTNGPGDQGSGIVPADGRFYPALTTSPATPAANEITALLFGPDGTVWVGTRGAGLLRYDGRRWSSYTRASTAAGLAGDTVTDLLVRDGRLWVATMKSLFDGRRYVDGGVSILDLATQTWEPPLRSDSSGLPDEDVSSLAMGADGRVWIGLGAAAGGVGVAADKHNGNGLAVVDPDSGQWQTFDRENRGDGVAGDTVLDLAMQGEAVWVASSYHNSSVDGRNHGGGVSRWAAGQWASWVGGEAGFRSYHGSGNPSEPDPFITGDVRSLTVDRQGGVWAGTWSLDEGRLITTWPYVDAVVNRFDGLAWRSTVFPGRGWASAIAADAFGQVWVGFTRGHGGHEFSPAGSVVRDDADGGLAVWTGTTWEEPSGISANAVTALAADPETGLMWVGTESGGLWARRLPPTRRGAFRAHLPVAVVDAGF